MENEYTRHGADGDLADRRVFIVDGPAWTELQHLIDRPPVDKPALSKLLSEPSVLSRAATDDGNRSSLDEVIAEFGFDRHELEAELDAELRTTAD